MHSRCILVSSRTLSEIREIHQEYIMNTTEYVWIRPKGIQIQNVLSRLSWPHIAYLLYSECILSVFWTMKYSCIWSVFWVYSECIHLGSKFSMWGKWSSCSLSHYHRGSGGLSWITDTVVMQNAVSIPRYFDNTSSVHVHVHVHEHEHEHMQVYVCICITVCMLCMCLYVYSMYAQRYTEIQSEYKRNACKYKRIHTTKRLEYMKIQGKYIVF
jgi:hypothetical protein